MTAQSPTPPAGGPQRDSRVLVFSQRHLLRPLWHVTQYEFEDVIGQVDDVTLVAPCPMPRQAVSKGVRRVRNASARRLGLRRPSTPWDLPDPPKTPVTADHDLFFAVFHYAFQLPYLGRIPGWRQRSRRAACLIIEMWRHDLDHDADYLAALREFDVVYVLNPAMAAELRARGLDARFLPTGVDALTFSPLPKPPRRVVDCYNYGRRSEVTHRALLDLMADQGLTYVYDTTKRGVVIDPREHRVLLANMMKRSDFFFAYTLNDSADRTATAEQNISTRYFEGAAGGAVLLGSRPAIPEFDACFDWTDAVVKLPYACHDIGDVLADLRRQPDRLAAARAANVRHSLLRHDWSHRWARVLADNGLAPTDAFKARHAELERQAAEVSPELLSPRRATRPRARRGGGPRDGVSGLTDAVGLPADLEARTG